MAQSWNVISVHGIFSIIVVPITVGVANVMTAEHAPPGVAELFVSVNVNETVCGVSTNGPPGPAGLSVPVPIIVIVPFTIPDTIVVAQIGSPNVVAIKLNGMVRPGFTG